MFVSVGQTLSMAGTAARIQWGGGGYKIIEQPASAVTALTFCFTLLPLIFA